MTERVVDAIPGSGQRIHTLYITEAIKFTGGGVEPKFRVKANVRFPKGREVHLIERSFGTDIDKRRRKGLYFANWVELKRVGLPVVDTVRETDEGTVFVTDVKADGSETYGKGLALSIVLGFREDDPSPRRRTNIDPLFKKIVGSRQIRLIEDQVNRCVDIATTNGIQLPDGDDAFELLVHPNGSWQLMILDLHEAKINVEQREDLMKKNRLLRDRFLDNLRVLRDRL